MAVVPLPGTVQFFKGISTPRPLQRLLVLDRVQDPGNLVRPFD